MEQKSWLILALLLLTLVSVSHAFVCIKAGGKYSLFVTFAGELTLPCIRS